jgi:hypothetical protein
MEKKTHKISFRAQDGQAQYVEAVAECLRLPTDGDKNVSRALQSMIEFMRTNFGLAWIEEQRRHCPTLQTEGCQ